MRLVRRAWVALALAGCASHGSCSKSAGAEGSGDAGPLVHLSGKTVLTSSGDALAGVSVCVYDRPELPCATSSASGEFDVAAPASSETGLTFALLGYVPILVPLVTSTAPMKGLGVSLPGVQGHTQMYQAFGATCPDAATGFLAAFAGTSTSQLGARGVRMTLDPNLGKGPFYLGDDGTPAPVAVATSGFSVGMFANIAPGLATITLSRAEVEGQPPSTMKCSPTFGGWPSPKPNSLRVPIAAGIETHVALSCTD